MTSNRSINPTTCNPAQYADYVEQLSPSDRKKALQAFERATDPVSARYVRQKVALLRASLALEGIEAAGAAAPEADAENDTALPQ